MPSRLPIILNEIFIAHKPDALGGNFWSTIEHWLLCYLMQTSSYTVLCEDDDLFIYPTVPYSFAVMNYSLIIIIFLLPFHAHAWHIHFHVWRRRWNKRLKVNIYRNCNRDRRYKNFFCFDLLPKICKLIWYCQLEMSIWAIFIFPRILSSSYRCRNVPKEFQYQNFKV